MCIYDYRTETGPLCMAMRNENPRPAEWEFFRLPSVLLARIELLPHGSEEGLLEPVLMVS